MSEAVKKLVELWRNAGLAIRPGVSLSAIHSFEMKYGVTLPNDLREYFLTVDGMEDDLDPGMNRFWPLEIVVESAAMLFANQNLLSESKRLSTC
jgi:cell wall assembly regulator SMI1